MKFRLNDLMHELKHHLPFTAGATVFAIIIALILHQYAPSFPQALFEGFHFVHIVLAAVVSAAMFYRYKTKVLTALLVGMFSSIVFGSVSDVVFPYLGALIFNLHPEFHMPLIEEPLIILGLGLLGGLLGVIFKVTKIPHFLHVGVSTLASMLYLAAYVSEVSIFSVIVSFIVVTLAVVVPCCIGDIILPFFFLGEKIKHCECECH